MPYTSTNTLNYSEQVVLNNAYDESVGAFRFEETVAGGGAATTGTITSVASSASSVTILALNANRKGAVIYNDSTAILYLALSNVTASATVYTVQIPAGGYFELPNPTLYTGILKGIWASANGFARVTELS